MKQSVRVMMRSAVKWSVLLLFALASPAIAQSKLPGIFQFSTAQFPGYNAFSAVNCVAQPGDVFVGIGDNNGPPYQSAIVRLDPGTMEIKATIPMPAGAWLNDMVLSPGKIWASDWATGKVYRADLASNTVDLTITTGFSSAARGVVYGNGVIMAADQNGGVVKFYDAVTGASVGAPVVVGSLPLYGGFDAVNGNFWVSVQNSNTVVKIDGTTLLALATISTIWPSDTSGSIFPFTILPDGGLIYTVTSGGYFTVLDGNTNAVVNRYRLESGSGGHFLAKVGTNFWIAQHGNNRVGVINEATGAYAKKIDVGKDPSGVCYDGTNVFSIDYESDFPPLTGWTVRRHNP